jgi:hypothetical protein
MLTAPLTVLNIRCPSVVYVNSSSHSFKHKVSISSLCWQPFSQYVSTSILCNTIDLTQVITSYNLLRNNNKFNCNTKSYYNTNKNVFLKYLATKTIESNLHCRILSHNELKFVTHIFQIFRWVDSNLSLLLRNNWFKLY